MRRLLSSRGPRVSAAALLALALVIGSTAPAAAKRPRPTPPPPESSPSLTIAIAATGTLEPSGEYANVGVTVSCAEGWAWSYGRLYVLQGDRGGAGTFTAACTGTAHAVTARVVNGNRFELGAWTATAYVGITRNGTQATATSSRTIQLEPGVAARIADKGQLTDPAGGGVRIAVAVACPIGAAGQASSVTVTQGGSSGTATFTPTCDRHSHSVVLSLPATGGTFQTGGGAANASVAVGWNGGSFAGTDGRSVAILESSTGDGTPPSTPAGLSAQTFGTGDGETELRWAASSDNATPTGQLVYEILLNGRFDQAVGSGLTTAILYADVGVLNTCEVVAVDGAGNRSDPASVTVDLRF